MACSEHAACVCVCCVSGDLLDVGMCQNAVCDVLFNSKLCVLISNVFVVFFHS